MTMPARTPPDRERVRKDLDDAVRCVAEVRRMLASAESAVDRGFWAEALVCAHDKLFDAQQAFAASCGSRWPPLRDMPRWLTQILGLDAPDTETPP